MNVIGYLRVSTDRQDYDVDAQREVIEREAERRGWTSTTSLTMARALGPSDATASNEL
ncbi:recombinase family protein [Microbacterium murale]|uniref:recombinase family protein n=1 Tax=Microbacterium murale TaxID=1081040 RepID=UPI003594583F